MSGKGAGDRGDTYVRDHLDREDGAEDFTGAGSGKFVGEQAKSYRGKAGAEQGGNLSAEEAGVSCVFQRRQHEIEYTLSNGRSE